MRLDCMGTDRGMGQASSERCVHGMGMNLISISMTSRIMMDKSLEFSMKNTIYR